MSIKEDVFNSLMEQVLAFIEKFKYIDKSVEAMCKKMSKTAISNAEFNEMMKLYNTTGAMFIKSLGLLDSIICRFPQELNTDELEMLEYYRKLSEAERFLLKAKLKEEIKINAGKQQ
uniref:Uncharacterized protein n=1 Tax=Siphoviridae sp. ctYh54 TaxID=2826379 RepID=A0A8S5MEA5_9CAUD|nr:MAG TPA: hypothetical protein [Siphoviridae sp. ctYh54]